MKKISNKEYEKYQQYQTDKLRVLFRHSRCVFYQGVIDDYS